MVQLKHAIHHEGTRDLFAGLESLLTYKQRQDGQAVTVVLGTIRHFRWDDA